MRNPRIHPASFLRRWWLLIAVAGAGGALVAYLSGTRATPRYEAKAQVLVQAGARESAEIPTYAEIVRSTPVVAYALRSTGSPFRRGSARECQGRRIVTLESSRFVPVTPTVPAPSRWRMPWPLASSGTSPLLPRPPLPR